MLAPAVVRVGLHAQRLPPARRRAGDDAGKPGRFFAIRGSRPFEDEAVTLVVDLTACNYLDSTFLGCLVVLHRRHGARRATPLVDARDVGRSSSAAC